MRRKLDRIFSAITFLCVSLICVIGLGYGLKASGVTGDNFVTKIFNRAGNNVAAEPVRSKTIKKLDDGTYQLSLSVTGDAIKKQNHVNVIVIVDRSGSMNDSSGITEVTYTESTDNGNPRYGLINGEYVKLDRKSSGWGWNTTYKYYYNNQEYTGDRYIRTEANQSRMEATKEAVADLANNLLSNNGGDNADDVVEMALITFATTAKTDIAKTSSKSTFVNTVNGLTVATGNDAGTNWEAALHQADSINFGDTDPTFVIFFSDGAPTFRTTQAGYDDKFQNGIYGSGTETEPNMERAYTEAVDDAEALATKVGKSYFYTIFAYGTNAGKTYMTNLTTAAGAPAANNYSASDTVALQQAFAAILNQIEMAGIGNVDIIDGTTSKVVTSTEVVHSLLTIDDKSFKYYKGGSEWAEAPEAKVVDGEVIWDLGDGVLENGVEYKVTFNVWPSQETLDTIADLKNGADYDELDAEVRQYLSKDYELATNTTAKVTYADTRVDNTIRTATIENPPAVKADSYKLNVEKLWDNDLDGRSEDGLKTVTLNVFRDGVVVDAIVMNEALTGWSGSTYIAPGIISKTGSDVKILETGHDYTLGEPENLTYHWELSSEVVHPMLINGVMTKLVLNEDVTISEGNHLVDGSKEYYKINGKVYEVITGSETLIATNNRRSYFEFNKTVTGESVPEDARFSYRVKVVNSMANLADEKVTDDDEIWFSVYDSKNEVTVKDLTTSATVANDKGYYKVASGTEFTVEMAANWNLRILNLPTGSTYEVEETSMPQGFIFEKVEGTNVKNTSSKLVSGTIEEYNTAYSLAYTNKYVLTDVTVTKNWVDNNNQDGVRPENIEVQLKADNVALGDPVTVDGNMTADTWTYTFTKLNKYNADGSEIVYTADETAVPTGYNKTTNGDSLTITNKHEIATADVTIKKVWDDNANRDVIRPTSVRLQLYANGEAYGDPVTLTGDMTGREWSYTFKDLNVNAGGKAIVYTVDETAKPEGYDKEVNGLVVTNKHTPATVTAKVHKEWDDNDNQDGKRPTSITVTLSDGTEFTLNEGNGWNASKEGLPKYRNNQGVREEIVYTWAEQAELPNDYQYVGSRVEDGVTIITNKRTLETTQATVVKVWDDENNRDGIQPKSLNVELNGTKYVLNADNKWTITVPDLPKNKDGREISYVWTEESVEGYTSDTKVEGTVTTFTNSHEVATKSVTVEKEWKDSNNRDGIRPPKVSLQLYANGVASGEPVEVTAEAGWKYTFTGLKTNDGGKPITYTVKEAAMVPGYRSESSGLKVTNTHEATTIDISVTKDWQDGENRDLSRPDSITVRLMNGETEVANRVMSDENGWSYTFEDVYKYENGQEIKYSIVEDKVTGYSTSVTGSVAEGFVVHNTYSPAETSVTVTKEWKDDSDRDKVRPETIKVTLNANGEYADAYEIKATEQWTHTFDHLPKNKAGKEITYTIVEDPVDGYTTTYDGYKIINTHAVETVDIAVKKTWDDNDNQDGLRPEEITVNVMNGEKVAATHTVVPDKSGNWKYTFEKLPKNDQGVAIKYTVKEVEVEGYSSRVAGTMAEGFTINNYHKPNVIDITATKVWDDDSDRDGLRTDDVTINLVVGEEVLDSQTASEANNWTVKFEGLAEKANGQAINYTVTEDAVEGYTTSVTGSIEKGFEVKNSHTSARADVTVTKEWKDNDNQDGVRPDEVVVTLYANGVAQGEPVTLNEDNEWSYTFEQLLVNENKKPIVYTVVEDAVEGYATTYDGLKVINSYDPEKTSVTVVKTWEDDSDRDGIRPTELTVKLLADGEEVATGTLTSEKGWTYTFEDLDKFKDQGVEIVYTIEEVEVEGYTSAKDGYKLTNTHEIETTEVHGTVTWDDEDDEDELRPDEVTICLYANGEKQACKNVSSEDETYDFGELPKNKDGEEIKYTVSEDDIDEYEISITGYDIVNKHVPDEGDVLGEKEEEPEPPVEEPVEEPEEEPEEVLPAKKDNDNPETGDTILPFALLLLTSLGGISFTAKKIVDRKE